MRRSFLAGLLALVGLEKAGAAPPKKAVFPPVPAWRPTFAQPLQQIVDRVFYYWDRKRDFVVFRNGTCVILDDNTSDADARSFALKVLSDIFNEHPDMDPKSMDDGNVLVLYNHPAANVVIREIAQAHWKEVEDRHLDGLTPSEVLMTPLGPNKFDDFGKQALLGRAYMFMDAQAPEIMQINRHS